MPKTPLQLAMWIIVALLILDLLFR